jgi:DNA-binding YbaB/EbfC family protein
LLVIGGVLNKPAPNLPEVYPMLDPNAIKGLQRDLQTRVDKMNEELDEQIVEGVSGGGVVKVRATANGRLREVEIGPEAVDPDDVEMLQDLVVAAVNSAMDAGKKLKEERVSSITGGLRFPGLL